MAADFCCRDVVDGEVSEQSIPPLSHLRGSYRVVSGMFFVDLETFRRRVRLVPTLDLAGQMRE
jgi:hypothetical protein